MIAFECYCVCCVGGLLFLFVFVLFACGFVFLLVVRVCLRVVRLLAFLIFVFEVVCLCLLFARVCGFVCCLCLLRV